MRIGLVLYGSLETLSGGYLYDRKLVAALRAQGDEVLIFSLPWRTYPRHLFDNLNPRLLHQTQAAQLDVLIQDELNHPSLVAQNERLRQKLGVPLVSIVHHLRSDEAHAPALQSLYRTIEKHYVNTIDGFIFNSQTTAQHVTALVEAPKAGIVAYPAADHLMPPEDATVAALIEQRAAWSGPLRVIAVGNVTPRKNLHVVIQALAHLPATSWTLTVAGRLDVDGAYSAHLQALAQDLHVHDRVRFLGRTDESMLRQLYATSHVLALPSFEGFGIVYLEAMSFGVTPIASTEGAAHEIITDGQDGYLTPPDDPVRLAQRLAALQAPARWCTMAYAARQRYVAQPTWQQSMAPVLLWLHEFVALYPQPPFALNISRNGSTTDDA